MRKFLIVLLFHLLLLLPLLFQPLPLRLLNMTSSPLLLLLSPILPLFSFLLFCKKSGRGEKAFPPETDFASAWDYHDSDDDFGEETVFLSCQKKQRGDFPRNYE